LEFAQAQFARPLGHEIGGEDALVAGHPLGERDAGVVAALDDRAMQEIVDRDLAVEGCEHGRAAGRGAAPPPRVFADSIFVGELDVALLDGMEDYFGGHELHHAGRRAQLVRVLFEQHAAARRLGQDRGRRVAVEAPLLLPSALHALIGGLQQAAPGDSRQDKACDQTAQKPPGHAPGLAER
jgi:hypothetical protein